MPFCSVSQNNVQLYYETHGSGPNKMIFVSGLGSISSQWDYQVEYFSGFPEFQICVFDNRGFFPFFISGSGLSSVPPGKYTTSMMAEDAIELVHFLDWEKFHIIGLSMGGMIAQELCLKVPARIESLALLSTYSKFNGLPAFEQFKLSDPLKILSVIKGMYYINDDYRTCNSPSAIKYC